MKHILPYTLFCLSLALSAASVSVETMPDKYKEDLCNKTKDTCSKSCNNNASDNQCDVPSLKWSCSCRDNKPSVPSYKFPIPSTMCILDHQNCATNCQHLGKQHNADQVCRLQCDSSFPCSTEKAPVDKNNGAAPKLDISHISGSRHLPASNDADSMGLSMYALQACLATAILLFGSM